MLVVPLTKEKQDEILKSINYNRKQLAQDLQYIRTWLASQEHLPSCKTLESDNFLSSYLVGCKGSIELTKRKLDAYYTARTRNETIFSTIDPLRPNIMKCRDYLDTLMVPDTPPDGGRICLIRVTDPNLEIYDFLANIQVVILMMEHKLRMEDMSGGDYYVLDAGVGYTPAHVLRLNASMMKDIMGFLETVLPWRFNKMIFINAPTYIDIAVNTFFKPFMKKKQRERIIVTEEGASALHKVFPKEILPKDYGGNAPSCKELTDKWRDLIEEKREWYMKQCTERVDESKRIITSDLPRNPIFGVHGSLKRLCLD